MNLNRVCRGYWSCQIPKICDRDHQKSHYTPNYVNLIISHISMCQYRNFGNQRKYDQWRKNLSKRWEASRKSVLIHLLIVLSCTFYTYLNATIGTWKHFRRIIVRLVFFHLVYFYSRKLLYLLFQYRPLSFNSSLRFRSLTHNWISQWLCLLFWFCVYFFIEGYLPADFILIGRSRYHMGKAYSKITM